MCPWWALRSSKPLFWLILEGGFDSHTLPQNLIMKTNIIINYLLKILWIILFFLIIFLDRNNFLMVVFTILILIFLTIITIIRSLISRNEWRKLIDDGDVEIKEKIKF